MLFRSLCLVICVVSIGVLFAYMHEMSKLMRKRLELDERFCNSVEDLESAVLAMQIDQINFQQDMREVLKKRQ